MSQIKKIFLFVVLGFIILNQSFSSQTVFADTSDPFPFVILSHYKETLNIGDKLYILAVTSNGKDVRWKSSDSKIASVSTDGIVTAKNAGLTLITARIKNAEASCYITVNKTTVEISSTTASIEHGETLKLSATVSNGSSLKWKSSKRSIATVDEYGTVTALKPGVTTITATADKTSAACTFTVKAPTVKLNRSFITLYRGHAFQLSADVSSKITPIWKTNKKSIAIVDAFGNVTALKNGTATITAIVDKVPAICVVTVLKPEITISNTEITLKKGSKATLLASVSSGNTPCWSSSNPKIVTINSYGEISALQKGKAYLYAAEDGTKARCIVHVTE